MNWINVNDKLPENNTSCIVWCENYTRDKLEFFSEVIFNSEYFGVKNNRFVNYENGGEYENDYTEYVTHWLVPKKPINVKKFLCQTSLEIQDKCDVQCKHCYEYFGDLEEQITVSKQLPFAYNG